MRPSIVLLLVSLAVATNSTPLQWSRCQRKHFGHSSFVCVCNATYCDSALDSELRVESPVQVSSDARGQRFATRALKWSRSTGRNRRRRSRLEQIVLRLDRRNQRQNVLGIGNSITDAAGINVNSLSRGAKDKLMRSYYGKDGLNIGLARTHIGGCDFSPREYSYVDKVGDTDLHSFALQNEDLQHKIPLILEAQRLRNGEALKLIASPWSAPPWMKTNNDYSGIGFLKRKHRQHWANYFIKYFEAYARFNISFWGLTAQNEPEAGFVPFFPFNCMGFSPSSQKSFIAENLGPSLLANGLGHLKLLAGDTQRPLMAVYANKILKDPEASRYVSGMGVHWYWDDLVSMPSVLDKVHEAFPDKFMLYTESCTGFHLWDTAVKIGDWSRGEQYLSSILENLRHYVTGWIDWNLALDMRGGPNWANNFVDSPIIVDSDKDLFYKQPMYYALGHVSRFLPENSTVIKLTSDKRLSTVAAVRPDGGITVVLLNESNKAYEVTLKDVRNGALNFVVGPKSFQTIVY